MKPKLFNLLGYSLTPPAFILNVGEWISNLNINQVFTFIISMAVVIFWFYKIKEQRFKAKQAEKELDNIPDHLKV